MIQTFLLLATETVVFILILLAVQFTALAFRNPFRPAWLSGNVAGIFGGLGIATALSIGVGFLIAGLIGAGLGAGAAIAITIVLGLAIWVAGWRLLRLGDRLRLADDGRSPFHLDAAPVPGTLGGGTRAA